MKKTDVFRSSPELDVTKVRTVGYLTCADALVFLRSIKDGVADVVFLDPPFNLGKDYGVRSSLEEAEPERYESYMRAVIREGIRALKPGGALFLYHLPYWATRLSIELQSGLEFRHWIAIAMKNGFARGRRLYPAHYSLLYYSKGRPRLFRRPKISARLCRHCHGLIKDYGGYKHIIMKQGLNLSDFWDDLSPLRHRSRKHRPANQLPLLLTDRVVDIAGRRGAMLVDPFVGSGTSLISALRKGMSFVGNDIAKANVVVTLRRLQQMDRSDIHTGDQRAKPSRSRRPRRM